MSNILGKSAIRRSLRLDSAGQTVSGLLLLVTAAELFFRFASAGTTVKALSLVCASCGIVVAGWRRFSLSIHVATNAAFAGFVGIYAATAAMRYAGLLKAGPHPTAVAVFFFSMMWALAAFVAASFVTFATYRNRSRSQS